MRTETLSPSPILLAPVPHVEEGTISCNESPKESQAPILSTPIQQDKEGYTSSAQEENSSDIQPTLTCTSSDSSVICPTFYVLKPV